MHQKFNEYERYAMQNDQLPIKSHAELEYNSIMSTRKRYKISLLHDHKEWLMPFVSSHKHVHNSWKRVVRGKIESKGINIP